VDSQSPPPRTWLCEKASPPLQLPFAQASLSISPFTPLASTSLFYHFPPSGSGEISSRPPSFLSSSPSESSFGFCFSVSRRPLLQVEDCFFCSLSMRDPHFNRLFSFFPPRRPRSRPFRDERRRLPKSSFRLPISQVFGSRLALFLPSAYLPLPLFTAGIPSPPSRCCADIL